MLRYITAGESHGPELTAIIDGVPAGLKLKSSDIDKDLKRRQGGYGRGGRQKIESDTCGFTSGVRFAKAIGSPITLVIRNLDWENWREAMSVESERPADRREVTRARPGHADLTGALKYGHDDLRNVLERSSARETAVRVAVGGVAKALLNEFGMSVYSYVAAIGPIEWAHEEPLDYKALFDAAEESAVRCPDAKATEKMKAAIDRARKAGDSLGGVFEVIALGVPPGLGSHVQWDRKLKARLAMALMSIQAIKGVEIGMGFAAASTPGSKAHDEIFYRKPGKSAGKSGAYWPLGFGFYRKTNHAGGLEGGMSNGEPIVLRAAMKPIPTLYSPLRSVDIRTKEPYEASIERSDITAVPSAAVIAEAAVALEIAGCFIEKFGGDSIGEMKRNYRGYLKQIGSF